MKKEIIAIWMCATLLLVVFSSGCLEWFTPKKEVKEETFLLVEAISNTGTKLISGNYTDGTLCIDFPTYLIDEGNKTLMDYMGSERENFKLVYGSGEYAGGLMKTGGATGLVYTNMLPFKRNVSVGDAGFNMLITVTENLEVYINDSYLLLPGEAINYTYDFEREYRNSGSNETCIIRYSGITKIKNYGIWEKLMIKFGG